MAADMRHMREEPAKVSSSSSSSVSSYAVMGLDAVSTLTEHVVRHPFLVVRRQCQMNGNGVAHLTPISLLPSLIRLHGIQGPFPLLKGFGSSLMHKGLLLWMEDMIPKLVSTPLSMLTTKLLASAIVTPFYSAALVESVQSDIATENRGLIDVWRDCWHRIKFVSWPMIPIWQLVVPNALFLTATYMASTLTNELFLKIINVYGHSFSKNRTGAIQKVDVEIEAKRRQWLASSSAGLVVGALLYPFETILHRLHVQGTRTIIDDLDSGTSVMAVVTRYEGIADCLQTILSNEGFSGLYKGFGALIAEAIVVLGIVRMSGSLIARVVEVVNTNDQGYEQGERMRVIPHYVDQTSRNEKSGESQVFSPTQASQRGQPDYRDYYYKN